MHRRLTDVAAPSDLILTQAEIVSEPKYLSDCPHGHLFLGHESPPRPVEKLRSLVVQRLCSDEVFFRKSFRHVNNASESQLLSCLIFAGQVNGKCVHVRFVSAKGFGPSLPNAPVSR